jgi:hypothetical protein
MASVPLLFASELTPPTAQQFLSATREDSGRGKQESAGEGADEGGWYDDVEEEADGPAAMPGVSPDQLMAPKVYCVSWLRDFLCCEAAQLRLVVHASHACA